MLAKFRHANNDPDLDLWTFSALVNNEVSFLAVAEVLWPEVVIVDGLVFLKRNFDSIESTVDI